VGALEVNPVRVVLEKSSQATAAICSTRGPARAALEAGLARAALEVDPARVSLEVDPPRVSLKKSDDAAGRLQTAVAAKPGDRRDLQPVRFSSALRTTFKLPRVRERRTK
jgi:hypothetical protein